MQDFDELGEYQLDDDQRVLSDDDQKVDQNNKNKTILDTLQEDGAAPKRQQNRRNLKVDRFLTDPNGIQALFKKFTMHPETVDGLKGRPGSETEDLRKIMKQYEAWHLNHYPLFTFELFSEKVKKFGKTGQQKHDVNSYLNKLRGHYTGQELLEELREAPKVVEMPDATMAAGSLAKGDKQIDSSAPNGIFDYSNNKGSHNLGLIDPEPFQAPRAAPHRASPSPCLPFDPNNLTDEQKEFVEKQRQIALAKKRKREEMEAEQREQIDASKEKTPPQDEATKLGSGQADTDAKERRQRREEAVADNKEDEDIDEAMLDDIQNMMEDESD